MHGDLKLTFHVNSNSIQRTFNEVHNMILQLPDVLTIEESGSLHRIILFV